MGNLYFVSGRLAAAISFTQTQCQTVSGIIEFNGPLSTCQWRVQRGRRPLNC